MYKKGITLIEMLLVVGIVSFISISTLTGFSISSERLKFQNQLSTLESFMTSHRAQGFNDKTGDNSYSIYIDQNQIQNITTDTISRTPAPNSPTTFSIPNEDLLLSPFNARPKDSNITPWPVVTSAEITINPQQRICEITSGSQEYLILHIPIRKPDEPQPSKHLYIHRQNCLIESLNDQIQD